MARDAKPPVSAYIRARNEARMIADVARAALQVADEVVVVDSGSTDDTARLAAEAGARVVRQDWLGNGHQKRFAEEQCRHDWLLDLDADEIVTPELAAEIRALFDGGEPPRPVYRTPMAIAPPVGEPWTRFGLAKRCKLYDRRVVRAPAHAAWDQFAVPAGVKTGRLKNPIIHHAFADTAHLVDKLNRNSSTRARELAPKPMPVLALRVFFGLPFYFARRYLLDGLFRGGVYGFSFALLSAWGRWLRDVKMFERRKKEAERRK
ncbi:glycosyltransferase family 2 protein [Amphiplicatus metriothermophilus]|uniref:Glycosyltransferase involved in cell wall bisynthesis n=1 Tax=Amphiplicatus metriothermophilus TaxID=1519374 RepID=A0A239PLD5_9PROT|nr:glycosyltransferase family 2 protein [Amphiplicatus metriothermophilus]MBB5517772.1 glycosyltransferase involved in cell wall biosynthesis [Amphiplicatus metriothermophilus]SNT67894.1 Glycosyltransferase involved in cell wall bisynthesis [Amphiplicatus metriothermophilus]